jgi:hypothetical protein
LSKHATAHDYDHGPTHDHGHGPFDYDGVTVGDHYHGGNGVTIYVYVDDGTVTSDHDDEFNDDGNGHHPSSGRRDGDQGTPA